MNSSSCFSIAAGVVPVNVYGRAPVSSTYSSTPSEYTSVAVVLGRPLTCSGLA